MDKASGKLTVYFEEPFWVGVFERIEDGKLSVAKVTFGAEPKDYEVQEYIQKYYFSLKFSPAVETVVILMPAAILCRCLFPSSAFLLLVAYALDFFLYPLQQFQQPD